MLDDAGYEDCSICASNSLDEFTIRDILMEGACVDSFGVGERMITSSSEPVFGGVYWSLAPDVRKDSMAPFTERVQLILVAAAVQQVHFVQENLTSSNGHNGA